MPVASLPYTYLAKRKYWRFRHPETGDVGLPGDPGDPEFHAKYAGLCERVERKTAPAPSGSWSAIIALYRKSREFESLADATQLDYGKTLDLLDAALGGEPFALTTRNMIKAVRDRYADKPRKAHKIKQMASALYSWADDNDKVKAGLNPAKAVRRIRRKGGEVEYACWSDWEFDLFCSVSIPSMVTAVMIARYTGQRAKDIVKMVWTDFQGDMIRVRQNKTGAPLMVSCHKALRDHLNELKRSRKGAVILTNAEGKPYNANSLSSAIGRAVKAAEDMPKDRSIHGIRYMAGADMEEAGCTAGQIASVLGHYTYQMAMKYATQRLRSKEAAAKREAADGA